MTGVLASLRDENSFFRAAMEWHFNPATGSPFWLEKAGSLGFDPRVDVRSHRDLRLFPNVANELRDIAVEALVPRGYGKNVDIVGAFESGGTTGVPKRLLLLGDWMKNSLRWMSERVDAIGFPRRANWLTVAPTGPHIFGRLMAELCRMRGGVNFSVDLDPRWVRGCLRENRIAEADRYAEHVVDQMESILLGQAIGVLVTTPPLLERIAERDRLVNTINDSVDVIVWGGAHLDPDSRHVLQREVFPRTLLSGQYGSTTILGGSIERSGPYSRSCVFDPFSPFTTFSVVDPETLEDVAEGERGQVVMHHISESLLLPNNIERDMATSVRGPQGSFGVSVADVAPIPVFQDEIVIEGVY